MAAGTVVKVEAATAAAKQPGTDSAAQGTTATAAAAAATTAAASTTGGAGSTNGSTPATSQAQTDTGLLAQGQATGPAQNQGGREREMCMNTCNRVRPGVCLAVFRDGAQFMADALLLEGYLAGADWKDSQCARCHDTSLHAGTERRVRGGTPWPAKACCARGLPHGLLRPGVRSGAGPGPNAALGT